MANIRMRVCFIALLTAAAACWAISDSAQADTFRIGAFSEDRTGLSNVSNEKRPFMGTLYDYMRAALLDPNALLDPPAGTSYAWPDGTDNNPYAVQFAAPIDDATNSLGDLDLLIMTEVKPLDGTSTAQQAEYDAIGDFVRAGGCLVLVVDSQYNPSNDSGLVNNENVIDMANAVLDALDTSNAGRAGSIDGSSDSDPSIGHVGRFQDWSAGSEVLHGLFPYFDDGTGWDASGPTDPETTDLSEPRLSATFNSKVVAGTWSHEFAWRDADIDSYLAMEIQPHTITDTAGAVMVVGDTIFSDFFVRPGVGSYPNVNNGSVLLNFVAQQMTMNEIPEPSVLAMLASGGLLAACWAVRRRRRKAA